MGQAASQQIEDHIDDKREDLGSNLRELEHKVKSATNWRHQFENRPMTFLGLAFGGGLLLAKLVGNGSDRRRGYSYPPPPPPGKEYSKPRAAGPPSPAMEQAQHVWENVKGALVGIAASRLKEYVDEVVPGFSAQYRQSEAEHGPSAHA